MPTQPDRTDPLAAFVAMEREGWADAAVAQAYADGFSEASAQHVPHLVRAVCADPGTRALDLCCGHGIVAEGLMAAGADVTALDFSPAMLTLARGRVPEATFVEGDAADLPFDAGAFDAVTIGLGIPHVPDPDAVLREARRVLAPGGRIAFTVWCGPERSLGWRAVFDAIVSHGEPGVALPPGPDANALAQERAATGALYAAGFEAPNVEVLGSFWTVDDPGTPFDLFRRGTVRAGALLHAQPDARLRTIRAAVAEAVRHALGPEGPWRVPMPAAMASGVAGRGPRDEV
jgi:SAM-dependent methyltransferase